MIGVFILLSAACWVGWLVDHVRLRRSRRALKGTREERDKLLVGSSVLLERMKRGQS